MESTHLVKTVVLNEYASDTPSHARIVIDRKMRNRIAKLQAAVRKLKVYEISEWDYTPEYLTGPDDGEEGDYSPWESGSSGCMDSLTMRVQDDGVYWHGFVKHTDLMVETERIDIKELKENRRVIMARRVEIPLLMDRLKFNSSRGLLNQRLKGTGESVARLTTFATED